MSEFLGTVTAFQEAVRHHDGDALQLQLSRLRYEFGRARDEDIDVAAGLLADVLTGVPHGRDAIVAVLIGACVERGAEAIGCAGPLLDAARTATEAAAEFCNRWQLGDDEAYPQPVGEVPPPWLFERLGRPDDPAVQDAVYGWWTLPMWQSAVAAVLSSKDARKALLPLPEFFEVARAVALASGAGTFLAQALAVIDDERLAVIYRPTLEGFEFTMSGIADNFQLHTLLAERLVTPGHLPGTAPSPEAVEACLAETRAAPFEYEGTGSFNLVAPDGGWIWNEGWPIDIPVVERHRLLILDPPSFARDWRAVRAFVGMPAKLELLRRISEDGVSRWMSYVSPADDPLGEMAATAAAAAEPPKKRWWHRHPEKSET